MTKNKRSRVSAALCVNDKLRLANFAKEKNITPSTVLREALIAYLSDQRTEKHIETESILEQRLRRLEDRLAAIMAKLTRAIAQNLYFTTLPFTKGGLPSEALSPKAFNYLWSESRLFASEWLKKAKISADENEVDVK